MSRRPANASGSSRAVEAAGSAGHPFDVDTAVTGVRDGEWNGRISERWQTFNGTPNGGYLLAICLRAMQRTTDRDPLAVTGLFLRPGSSGPTQIRVATIRRGRRLTMAEARLMQDGKECLRATAVFADEPDAGDVVVAYPPPALDPPEGLTSSRDLALPGVSIGDRLEYRVAQIPGFLRGRPSGLPQLEYWVRFVPSRAPDLLSLAFFVDAFPTIAVEVGQLSATVTLTAYLRAKPAPGWLACRIQAKHIGGGVHDQQLDIWDSAGALVAQGHQLAALITV